MIKAARSRQRGQTLIIIFLGVLLLGGASHALNQGLPGGSIKELRSRIKEVVQDPARRDALLDSLDALAQQQKDHEKRYQDMVKNLLADFANPAGTAADFEQAFAAADALNADVERNFLASHALLRGKLSADEWRKVFPPKDERTKTK